MELYALWGQAALSRIDENEPETFLVDCVLPTVAFGMLQVAPLCKLNPSYLNFSAVTKWSMLRYSFLLLGMAVHTFSVPWPPPDSMTS